MRFAVRGRGSRVAGVPRSAETAPLCDPTVRLCLGPYGGPWEGGAFYERGNPAGARSQKMASQARHVLHEKMRVGFEVRSKGLGAKKWPLKRGMSQIRGCKVLGFVGAWVLGWYSFRGLCFFWMFLGIRCERTACARTRGD